MTDTTLVEIAAKAYAQAEGDLPTEAGIRAAVAVLEAEVHRWHSAYEIAHDQATENGIGKATAARQRDDLAEALRVFMGCAYAVSTEINPRGHNWCEAYLDQALPIAIAALSGLDAGKDVVS